MQFIPFITIEIIVKLIAFQMRFNKFCYLNKEFNSFHDFFLHGFFHLFILFVKYESLQL